MSPNSLLEKYKSKLCNVHMSNRAHKPFDSETPKLKTFMAKLEEYRYAGPLTLELSRKCTIDQILKTKAVLDNFVNK